MKKLITLIIISLVVLKSNAQEIDLPTYLNHMMENPFLISPAYAGIGNGFQSRINGISQWVGVDNAPDTQSLSIEARLKDRLGGGITLYNDSNGFTRQMGVKASFAYHLMLSDKQSTFLSFALGANFTQFSIDTNKFNKYNDVNEALPSISEKNVNFDFSTLFRYGNAALSVNIFNILDKDVKNVLNGEPLKLRRYSLYPVYVHRIDSKYEIEPSVYYEFYESDLRSHVDFNMKIRRKIKDGYIWLGASYTTLIDQNFRSNKIAPLIGIKKKKYFLAYGTSFDFSVLASHNVGTHMITLGYDFDFKPSLARCTQRAGMF